MPDGDRVVGCRVGVDGDADGVDGDCWRAGEGDDNMVSVAAASRATLAGLGSTALPSPRINTQAL